MAVTQRLQDASGVIATDELGNTQLAIVSSTPAAEVGAGYAKGCILINSGSTGVGDLLFANIGTDLLANFNVITVVAD